MPAGDGTGPSGFGPMTGRAAGFCAGYGMSGYANPVPGRGRLGIGRGFGRGRGFFGRGRGRGWRHWYNATGLPGWARTGYAGSAFGPAPYFPAQDITPKDEMNMLKNQAEFLKTQLEDVQNRISTLEKAQSTEK